MPAPKKAQALKEQTRHWREIRKHRKACRTLLGPVGMRLFREFLNLHGRIPIQTTANWAQAFAQVYGKQGSAIAGKTADRVTQRDLYDHRGQFGGWSQALLHRRLDLPLTGGLCFMVRIVEVKRQPPNPWRALLVVLYERQNGVIFHDLVRMDRSGPAPGDVIWRAVDQAIHRLSGGRWPYFALKPDAPPAVTVAFPVGQGGKYTHRLLAAAEKHSRKPEQAAWQLVTFRGLRHRPLDVRSLSFLEFERMLRQQSRKVSLALRSLRPGRERANTENNAEQITRPRPAWLLLFPRVYHYEFHRGD